MSNISKPHDCCKDCEHALFNTLSGEYKCSEDKTYISNPGHTCCQNFIKRKGELNISKEGEEYGKY